MYMCIYTQAKKSTSFSLLIRMTGRAGRNVPPPTVPTSREGMVQLIYRSWLRGPPLSKMVIQLELHTTWAGSWENQQEHSVKSIPRSIKIINYQLTCPVAMKMAVTIFIAWALKPPTEPAMADPIRFLLVFTSTKESTLVFKTFVEKKGH